VLERDAADDVSRPAAWALLDLDDGPAAIVMRAAPL
jgi:hypothetical protein